MSNGGFRLCQGTHSRHEHRTVSVALAYGDDGGGGTTMILPEGAWSIHQPSGVTPTNRARCDPARDRGLVLSDSEMRSRG
jgi:hypothetical protein